MSRLKVKLSDKDNSTTFKGYVVAIGASAGGLDALERFFQEIPADTGIAFVVVQHLSPDHKSMMSNLLARHTKMPVDTVEDAMNIEANHVYLIPPGAMMTVSGSQLRLSPKNPRVLSLPIDLFFTSLAQEFSTRTVGVVLSGTGSDGTRGAVAINDAGGFLLAQDPESAKFDGMPRSVIATGLVDEVLAPESLGPRILEHVHQEPRPRLVRGEQPALPLDNNAALEEIFHLLQQIGGVNFRDYKPATVLRRIDRRMQVRHVPDFESYLHLMEAERGEVITLRREILIPVTNFFRDTESFEELGKFAVSSIVEERRDFNNPIRVWVTGVCTGEEAYSMAILFAEAFERAKRWPNLKIFATDVEQLNVDAAGAGVFSEAISTEVSPERLVRFFDRRGNHFVVKGEIRQNIIFARHNLLEDPPFTRMDLVSCRNVLIYFQTPAQERVLRRLQYALAPGGHLFLGSSESLGALQRDFSPVSSKHKIFKILRHLSLPLDLSDTRLTRATGAISTRSPPHRRTHLAPDAAAIDAGQGLLLQQYAPPSLLVNARHDLLHVYGRGQRYLRFSEGSVSLELVKLLPERLAPVAIALLHKTVKDKTPIRSDVLALDLPEGRERVRLIARPVDTGPNGEPALLLSFLAEPIPEATERPGIDTIDVDAETTERMQTLERELAATRESLQATIEELETANEELQASNEELMASNEELQSSNEELQSVNEELYTVNAENQEKIEILNRLNADLDSMAKAASIGTVFVDAELRLTRFTPEATNLFKIRDTDIGRPIDDFVNLLDYPDFIAELRSTLARGEPAQREVLAANGKTYLARILPYSVRSSDISGVVASFVDITSLYDASRLQGILDSLLEHVAVLDNHGTITLVNAAWMTFAQANGDPKLAHTGVGSSYLHACQVNEILDDPLAQQAHKGVLEVLSGQREQFSMEYPCHSPTEQRWFLMHAAPIKSNNAGAVISHIDITNWVRNREFSGGTHVGNCV